MSLIADMPGRKFGKWLVIERAPPPAKPARQYAMWLCECECGHRAVVRGCDMRDGNSLGCTHCLPKMVRQAVIASRAARKARRQMLCSSAASQ
jgi:hypothetical protein